MKILVFSDSHGAKKFMRACIEQFSPDAVFHLGDCYEDVKLLKLEYPGLPFVQVPGNCDRYRDNEGCPEIKIVEYEGVSLYLTHGHLHGVKYGTADLVSCARQTGVQGVLFGHTHNALCRREEDGFLVLNPGTCGYLNASAALLELHAGEITACNILRP